MNSSGKTFIWLECRRVTPCCSLETMQVFMSLPFQVISGNRACGLKRRSTSSWGTSTSTWRYVGLVPDIISASVTSDDVKLFLWPRSQGRGIEDPAEIIFEMSKEERKDFYRSVALGLNRPLFAVYRRVLRMYDNRNHVGKWVHREKMV